MSHIFPIYFPYTADVNQIYSTQQDAAHEPECSHVELFCDTNYLNSLHFSPVTVPVHRRLWNTEQGGVQSVECRVWSVECGK